MNKITREDFEELSSLVLGMIRDIDDIMGPKGWNGWTTGGMRMMTDDILREILNYLKVEREYEH